MMINVHLKYYIILSFIFILIMGRAMAMDIPEKVGQTLLSAQQGELIKIDNFDMRNLPTVDWKSEPSEMQYIFSDDPEYLRVPECAAVREKVKPGIFRLYLYHVNAIRDNTRKITAVIKNLGEKPLRMRFLKYASQGPSVNYNQVGKMGLFQYFNSQTQKGYSEIPVGGSIPIDNNLEVAKVNFDELVHGFYDIEIDQPALITVLQTNPETPGTVASERIKDVQPPRQKMGAGRGLYHTGGFKVTNLPGEMIDTAKGAVQLIVADGKRDLWIKGWDTSTSSTCKLGGNYGVIYDIDLKWRSSDGRGLAVVMWNMLSRSRYCTGMTAAVVVNEGKFPGGVIQVPTGQGIIQDLPEAALVQIYPEMPAGEVGSIHITYSPPGASCLPVPIVFIPIRLSNTQ